jgi:hypothetical protein
MTETKNRRAILENYAQQHGFEPLVAANWYDVRVKAFARSAKVLLIGGFIIIFIFYIYLFLITFCRVVEHCCHIIAIIWPQHLKLSFQMLLLMLQSFMHLQVCTPPLRILSLSFPAHSHIKM